jgi:hypothetical protein
VPLLEAPEAGEVALAVELEIIEYEHPLAVQMRLVMATNDQRPVQALLQLYGLVDVGVVPERPRIGQHEPVLERLPGRDGLLHQLGAVHLGWDAQSVPVNAGRLGKGIGQFNYQGVADVRLDGGAGHLPVEPVPRHDAARRDLPLGLSGLKPDVHRLLGTHRVRTHRSFLPPSFAGSTDDEGLTNLQAARGTVPGTHDRGHQPARWRLLTLEPAWHHLSTPPPPLTPGKSRGLRPPRGSGLPVRPGPWIRQLSLDDSHRG